MRGKTWVGIICAVVVMSFTPALWAAEGTVPSVESLIYQEATVKTQVDVNGAAAVMLVGKVLDTIAAQAQSPAVCAQMDKMGGQAAMAKAGMPLVEPMKETIKSLDHITVLIQQPKGETEPGQFVKYYSDLMTDRGWSSLVTVRDQTGVAVVAMIAPEAKGVFLAVNDKNELVTALLTTTKPIGDLLGQLVQAGAEVMPMVLSHINNPPSPPAPPAKAATPPQPKSTPKKK